jgi:cardiolipin synthase
MGWRAMTETPSQTYSVDGILLTPYFTGAQRMDALISLIDAAKSSLRLFYYIFNEDRAGTKVRDALLSALGR